MKKRPGIWDVPEIPGFGSPLDSEGLVGQSQKMLAEAFNADRVWFGVNGATGLLHSALLAIVKPGQAVLIPRNVHKSIINACIVGSLKPVFFDLPFLPDTGHMAPPDELWFKKIFESITSSEIDIGAVILVNPTYQGYSCQLEGIIEQIHSKNLPVLVDESHGTYFCCEIEENLSKSALKSGADLVVNSLHKSASGLAQTAVLWQKGNRINPIRIESSIGLLQTSSPSSLLLVSCEEALMEFINVEGKKKLASRLKDAIEIFDFLLEDGVPLIKNDDPLKLVLNTARYGITGFEADKWFISRGVIAELPEPGCLTFCLGLSCQKGLEKILKSNWDELKRSYSHRSRLLQFQRPPFSLLMSPKMSCTSAFYSKSRYIPIENSLGEISAEMLCPYPPGIPMLIPGEILDENRINWLIEHRSFWPEHIPSEIKVVL